MLQNVCVSLNLIYLLLHINAETNIKSHFAYFSGSQFLSLITSGPLSILADRQRQKEANNTFLLMLKCAKSVSLKIKRIKLGLSLKIKLKFYQFKKSLGNICIHILSKSQPTSCESHSCHMNRSQPCDVSKCQSLKQHFYIWNTSLPNVLFCTATFWLLPSVFS